MLVFGKLTDGG